MAEIAHPEEADPSPRPRKGFLLGLGFLLVVLGAAAFLAIPHLLAANLCSMETGAIANLRNLAACQEQYRSMAAVDSDGDGIGEYGTIGEMTGVRPPRAAPGRERKPLQQPLLSPALRKVTTEGWVEKAHYAVAVFLPRAGGGWLREVGDEGAAPAAAARGCTGSQSSGSGGGRAAAAGAVDPDAAEAAWCAMAWPRMLGERQRRIFLVTATGEVYQSANERGTTCTTELPGGPEDALPAGWKPGDALGPEFRGRGGDLGRATN